MDSLKYQAILAKLVLPLVHRLKQGNHPKVYIQAWIRNQSYNVFEWPVQFLD